MKNQRICVRCVSDTSIPNIRFDENGVCNFCKIHDRLEEEYPLNEPGQQRLNELIDKIKAKGKNKKYDCVVGISGGTDSTYCLYKSKKLGLRPLAVHLDNGWDSEIAIKNIKNAVRKLDIDLKMITCNWEEFKDLQISFLKASVPDAEIPTDVAIHGVLHQVAAEEGIKYIINGHSFRTEGIAPIGWTYMDGKYIQSVQKIFGNTKLKSFPNLTISSVFYYTFIKRIKVIPLLNYFRYSKEDARKILEKEVDWTYYGGHHFESIYTHFIIVYLLMKKFKIDKRKTNFSAHVRSGMMSREQALEELRKEPPVKEGIVEHCIEKLGLTSKEFNEIMAREPRTFHNYPTYYPVIKVIKFPVKIACKLNIFSPVFYEKFFG